MSDVGRTPAIDGLVFVTDDADVPMLIGEQSNDGVLGDIGVLKLVDEQVAILFLVFLQYAWPITKKPHRLSEQVVKVQQVSSLKRALVLLVDACDQFVEIIIGRQ